MNDFININSTIVPLQIENLDTDQIIPARFLKTTSKEGLGENLFRDLRFNNDGSLKSNSILNNPKFKGEILVAGKNFGCGSSREHAVWALKDYGFNVVISSSFSDIFKQNALKNLLLPITISESFLSDLFNCCSIDNFSVSVCLNEQKVTNNSNGKYEIFKISSQDKDRFIKGIDDIELMCLRKNIIEEYEMKNLLF